MVQLRVVEETVVVSSSGGGDLNSGRGCFPRVRLRLGLTPTASQTINYVYTVLQFHVFYSMTRASGVTHGQLSKMCCNTDWFLRLSCC